MNKTTLSNVLSAKPSVSIDMENAINQWNDMYQNIGKKQTMNLASTIASYKARLVTLEMNSTITSAKPDVESKRAEYLNANYKTLLKELRTQIEYGLALGGLVIKPYVKRNPKVLFIKDDINGKQNRLFENTIEFDYVYADNFYPISFSPNGDIIEACFVERIVNAEVVYTKLEHHKLTENNTVIVENLAFRYEGDLKADLKKEALGSPISLEAVPQWATIEPYVEIEGMDRLLFAYFKNPDANIVDKYSPLGVSCFARAVSLIEDADQQYSRLLWEFDGGELAVFVDRDALKIHESGSKKYEALSKHDQRLYKKLDIGVEGDTLEVFAPQLRDQSIINGLNTILIKIEDACSLERGALSEFEFSDAKTATEVKMSKQRCFASIVDIQASLENTLNDVVYIMDAYCSLYNLAEKGDYNISFEWGDSIVTDADSELDKRLTLLNKGLMSKVELRKWFFGETESQAEKAIEEAEKDYIKKLEIDNSFSNKPQNDNTKDNDGKLIDGLDGNPKGAKTDFGGNTNFGAKKTNQFI